MDYYMLRRRFPKFTLIYYVQTPYGKDERFEQTYDYEEFLNTAQQLKKKPWISDISGLVSRKNGVFDNIPEPWERLK